VGKLWVRLKGKKALESSVHNTQTPLLTLFLYRGKAVGPSEGKKALENSVHGKQKSQILTLFCISGKAGGPSEGKKGTGKLSPTAHQVNT
jgi:hypothetical protein